MLDRRELEYFLALTVHGSFVRAAAALGISQPSLSQTIAKLEESTGARLVERRRHGVEVTAVGLRLVPKARAALDALREADQAAAPGVTLRNERLDIVCPPTLSQDPLARLVGRFSELHPHVGYRLQEPGADRMAATMVRHRHAEVAITTHPDMDEGMTIVPLGTQNVVAVLAADTEVDDRPTVATLMKHGLLCSREGGLMRRLLEDRVGREEVRRTTVLESTHNVTLLVAAAAGMGATFVPERVAERAVQLGLRVVRPIDELEREVYLLHRQEPLSPVAEAFVQYAAGANLR